MYRNLLHIHATFNGKNVTQQNALVYEAQLEEHITTLLDIMQYVNTKLREKLLELLCLGETAREKQAQASTMEHIRLSRARLELGQIIRDFMESMGGSCLNLGMVCLLWDFIFLKAMARRKSVELELYLALSIFLSILEEDIMDCRSLPEFVALFKDNMQEIQAYDYYVVYLGLYKTRALPQMDDEDNSALPPRSNRRKPPAQSSIEPTANPPAIHAARDALQPPEKHESAAHIPEDKKYPAQNPGSSHEAAVPMPDAAPVQQDNEQQPMRVEDIPAITGEVEKKEPERNVTKVLKPAAYDRGTLGLPDIGDYDILAEPE